MKTCQTRVYSSSFRVVVLWNSGISAPGSRFPWNIWTISKAFRLSRYESGNVCRLAESSHGFTRFLTAFGRGLSFFCSRNWYFWKIAFLRIWIRIFAFGAWLYITPWAWVDVLVEGLLSSSRECLRACCYHGQCRPSPVPGVMLLGASCGYCRSAVIVHMDTSLYCFWELDFGTLMEK